MSEMQGTKSLIHHQRMVCGEAVWLVCSTASEHMRYENYLTISPRESIRTSSIGNGWTRRCRKWRMATATAKATATAITIATTMVMATAVAMAMERAGRLLHIVLQATSLTSGLTMFSMRNHARLHLEVKTTQRPQASSVDSLPSQQCPICIVLVRCPECKYNARFFMRTLK